MSQIIRLINLEGKDYLDQWEAADYMCMSLSKFKQTLALPKMKIKPFNNHGKTVYRKADLAKEIERQAKLETVRA
jgi:predicted DNA-binding protein (UPF0251 family)